MNNLYEALEVCLQDVELGADIETTLLRYPDLANELRPMLETSAHAKRLASPLPSEEVLQRNRSKILQRAAEMREAQWTSTSTPTWFQPFRRAAMALAILAIIFLSGTGLVRASSTTLPGDNLYPVKRTCEDLALFFTFDSFRRNSLEVEYENERLEELYELIAKGRSAKVDFAGVVTQQNGSEWLVSGIRVVVSTQTNLHDGPVVVGDAIRVFGITQSDTSVVAERIDQLPPDANLPDLENSGKGSNSGSNSGSGSGNDNHGNDNDNENDSSGPGNGNDNDNDNGGNDNNSGPGNGDNNNDDSSGPGGGSDNGNENNSGSGSGQSGNNDNVNDDNSGPGSRDDNENNSGPGSGNDNDDNSGSGGGNDNNDEDNSGPGGGGGDDG